MSKRKHTETHVPNPKPDYGPKNPPPGYVYVFPVEKHRRVWYNGIGQVIDISKGCVVRNRTCQHGDYFYFKKVEKGAE